MSDVTVAEWMFAGVFAAVALVFWGGCATSGGLSPPDLGPAETRLEQRLDELDETDRSIRRDLEQLDESHADLESAIGQLVGSAAPLALIRLVGMDCLNTEYQEASSPRIELDDISLHCRATHLEHLRTTLSELPRTTRGATHQLLYQIDQARLLRGRIGRRLSQLGDDLTEGRDFVADQRAMLRQIEADIEQRQSQYSATARRTAHRRIDEHRTRLDALQQRQDEIDELRPEWSRRVDSLMASVYFELSNMRRTSQSSARLEP